jgi:hypothetical protein
VAGVTADEIARILDVLGEKLGPAGERVYALALRQMFIDGIIGTGLFVATTVIAVLAIRPVLRWVADGNSYGDRGMAAGLAGVAAAVLWVVLLINFAGFALPRLLNPEYAAIRDLLGSIR